MSALLCSIPWQLTQHFAEEFGRLANLRHHENRARTGVKELAKYKSVLEHRPDENGHVLSGRESGGEDNSVDNMVKNFDTRDTDDNDEGRLCGCSSGFGVRL